MDKLNIYLNQDINNPKYLFHGSPKKLDKLVPMFSHDSDGNIKNIAEAIFLFPSLIKSTPYAFKDIIKEYSEGLEWNFVIPNGLEEPIMTMYNVNVFDDIVGYIYVLEKDEDMIKDSDSLQYKCYKELVPIDVIEVKYEDYKRYFKVINDKIK